MSNPLEAAGTPRTSTIGVPRDKEQIAAEQGIVTDAQRAANKTMEEQIKIKEQKIITERLRQVTQGSK